MKIPVSIKIPASCGHTVPNTFRLPRLFPSLLRTIHHLFPLALSPFSSITKRPLLTFFRCSLYFTHSAGSAVGVAASCQQRAVHLQLSCAPYNYAVQNLTWFFGTDRQAAGGRQSPPIQHVCTLHKKGMDISFRALTFSAATSPLILRNSLSGFSFILFVPFFSFHAFTLFD